MAELASTPQDSLDYLDLADADPAPPLDINPKEMSATKLKTALYEYNAGSGRDGLIGLSWVERKEKEDEDEGEIEVESELLYVISAYDELHTTKEEVRRSLLPTPYSGPGGILTDNQWKYDWPGIKRKRHYTIQDDTRDRYTVDVYDLKNEEENVRKGRSILAEIKPFLGDELFEHIVSPDPDDALTTTTITNIRRLNPKVRHEDRSRTQTSKAEIAVPIKGSGNIFWQVMQHQRRLKLTEEANGEFDDWVGLTWQHGTQRYQIVRDTLVQARRDIPGKKSDTSIRTWVAKFYDERGRILGRKTFRDSELNEYFESAAKTHEKPLTDLRWEQPAADPTFYPHQLSCVGWLAAIGAVVKPEIVAASANTIGADDRERGVIRNEDPAITERRRRRQLGDFIIAKTFTAQAAFKEQFIRQVKLTASGKQEVTPHRIYTLTPDIEKTLQEFVREDIMEILYTALEDSDKHEPGELSIKDWKALGRILREQFSE
jgi:hypothetical protein